MSRSKRNMLALAVGLALGGLTTAAFADPTCIGGSGCNTNEGGSASAAAAAVAGAAAGVDFRSDIRNTSANTNLNSNTNVLGQHQGQLQGQHQGQGQGQLQGNIGLGSGNTTSTAIQIDAPVIPAAPDKVTIRNNPDIALGGLYPSAACHGTSNAGFSGGAIGVAIGSSWKDDDCGIRETARIMDGLGLKQDALAVLCSSPYAVAAPSCKAMKKAEAETVAQAEKRRVSGQREAVATASICERSKDEIVLRRNGCL